MHHKLTLNESTVTESSELTEESPEVQRAAQVSGLSVHAVMSQYRRMRSLASSGDLATRQFQGYSDFVGLGFVAILEKPGVLRSDGWKAHTIGADAIVQKPMAGKPPVFHEVEEAVKEGKLQRFGD